MKFKIASVLELAVPLSIAALLSAFLGCGGGGAYGNGTGAYDGTWSLNLKGYALPAENDPSTGAVACDEDHTVIEIIHGQGTVTQGITCINSPVAAMVLNIGVTMYPTGSGVEGTVTAATNGEGGAFTGTCPDRVFCKGDNLLLIKCGEAASGC